MNESATANEQESQIGGGPGSLAEEIAYYRQHLAGWGTHEGEHVLIHGSAEHGFYGTRRAALTEGYRRFGRVPFLVKQVILDEKPRTLAWILP